MKSKLTWLAGTLTLVLIAAPALVAQTSWVVSGDDDDDKNKQLVSTYALFGYDDSAFLGVTMEEETEHAEGGALITSVVDGSPADKAGIEEGDIVIRFGKDTIRGPVALTKKIRDLEPGDEVEITVLRDGRRRSFDVELGERSSYSTQWSAVAPRVLSQLENLEVPDVEFDAQALAESLKGLQSLAGLEDLESKFFDSDEWNERIQTLSQGYTFNCEDGDCDYRGLLYTYGKPKLGVQLTETTPELREHLGGGKDAGVLVSKVVKNSAAEDAGVQVGDLIVDVDGDEIGSTSDLRRALAKRDGAVFDIEVIRDGRSMTLTVTLEKDEEDRPTGPRASYRAPKPVVPATVLPPVAPPVPFAAPLPPVRGATVAPALAPAPAAPLPPRPALAPRVRDEAI